MDRLWVLGPSPRARAAGTQARGGSDLVQFPFLISLNTLAPDTPRARVCA